MKYIRTFILYLLTAIISFEAFAQDDYSIEIKNDQKTLYFQDTQLAPSTPVLQVLIAMPELLVRPGESVFDNYDVQLEGISLGVSTEEMLGNTRLFDVEKIVISESAVSSYLNNGQGGSINIILKKPEEGVSGTANLTVYTLPDAQTSLQTNWCKDKLLLRGWLSMEYYDPAESIVNTTNSPISSFSSIESNFTSDTTNTRYGHEMARLLLEYTPSERDKLKFNLTESLKLESKDIKKNSNDGDQFTLKANAEWEHKINSRSGTMLASEFNGNSSVDNMVIGQARTQSIDVKSNLIAGKAEYWRQMLNEESPNTLKLLVGVNFNWSNQLEHNVLTMSHATFGLPNQDYTTNGSSLFISPYLITESQFEKWHIKTSLEYQYYNYSVGSSLEDRFEAPRMDITGKVMVGWQFTEHQHVRILLDRKLKRPSYSQLYPFKLFNMSMLEYTMGNADLVPIMIDEAGVDYITDFVLGNGYFIANAGLHYIHAEGNINTVSSTLLMGQQQFGIPNPFSYKTFINSGSSNILNTELMLLYQLGVFNLSVTGNLYDQIKTNGDLSEGYSYFNWSIHPGFHLNHGWNLSLKTIFNSKIQTSNKTLGRYSYSYLNIDKGWKRLTLSLHGLIPFTRTVTDTTVASNNIISAEYKPIAEYVSIGASFRF